MSLDSDNGDTLQCLANLRILRDRDEEAGKLLDKVMAHIFNESNNNDIM